MSLFVYRAIAFSFLLIAPLSWTAENPDALSEAEQIREEIVVTADRSAQQLQHTGNSISVILRDRIEKQGLDFATDAMRQIPGLSVSQSGPIGSTSQIRIRGAEANHTLVLIDGFNANDPAIGSEFNFADLMTFDIDQIEVVRGAQTALYGSDTIGGVINFITSKPNQPGFSGKASIAAGNNQTSQYLLNLNAKGERHYALANISKYTTNGTNTSLMGSEDDGYENQTELLKFGFELTRELDVTLQARRSSNRVETDPQDFAFPPTETQGLVIDGKDWSKTSQKYNALALSYKSINKPISSTLKLGSTRTNSRFYQDSLYALANAGARDSIDWLLSNKWSGNSEHVLSASMQHEKLKFKNRSASYLAANYDESLRQSGFSVMYRLSPSTKTHFNFSARHDQNSRFKDEQSFKVSASQLLDNLSSRFHGSIATGSTNPSFIELFGYAPSNFEGNPNLEPEKSVSYDLGVEQSFLNNQALLDLTVFRADLKDEIIAIFDPTTFMSSSQNDAQKSTRFGLELSAQTSFNQKWHLAASYTYLKSKDGSRLTEVRRPKNTGHFSASYQFNNELTHFNINISLNGEQEDLEFIASTPITRVTLDSYVLVNTTLNHTFSKRFKAHLRIKNLLNDRYSEVFSYRATGRTVLAGLEYQF